MIELSDAERRRDAHPAAGDKPFRFVSGASTAPDTIDLTYLFWAWLKWSWVPVVAAALGAYYGYDNLRQFEPRAIATMIVQPAAAPGGSSSPLPSGLGAAAAQFGIQLGGGGQSEVSPFDRFRLMLGSIDFASVMQEKYQLLQRIYASSWDPVAGAWKRPSGEAFERSERMKAWLRQNQWAPPNLETLANHIKGSIRIAPATTSGFEEISVTHEDPEYAYWLLTTVFKEADALLRARQRQQSIERRAFIERQMEGRANIQMQEVLRSLLSQELSKELTFVADANYAASVVEPAHVLNARTEPNLPLIFGGPMSIAFIAAFLLVTFFAVVIGERRRPY